VKRVFVKGFVSSGSLLLQIRNFLFLTDFVGQLVSTNALFMLFIVALPAFFWLRLVSSNFSFRRCSELVWRIVRMWVVDVHSSSATYLAFLHWCDIQFVDSIINFIP